MDSLISSPSSSSDSPVSPDYSPPFFKNNEGYPKIRKIKRSSRYFDNTQLESDFSLKCAKCGKFGHTTSNCISFCFLCAYPNHIASQCTNTLCHTCLNRSSTGKECIQPRHFQIVQSMCLACGSHHESDRYSCISNFLPSDMVQNIRCYICEKTGHMSCKEENHQFRVYCANCGQKGHYYNECQSPPMSQLLKNNRILKRDYSISNSHTSSKICYRCKSIGHLVRECPKNSNCKRFLQHSEGNQQKKFKHIVSHKDLLSVKKKDPKSSSRSRLLVNQKKIFDPTTIKKQKNERKKIKKEKQKKKKKKKEHKYISNKKSKRKE